MAKKIQLDPEFVRRFRAMEEGVAELKRRFPPPRASQHHPKAYKPLFLVYRVKLTQTGGSAGSASAAVSFTYTVKDLNDVELATAKAPEWPSRSENGVKTAATQGLAYRDTSGDWQIAVAFEKAGTGSCA